MQMTQREYTEAKKRVIRAMLETGKSTKEIADEFGVERQSMWQFIRRYELDRGLNRATKKREDYYVNQRVRPALAAEEDVRILKILATDYAVDLRNTPTKGNV